MENKKEWIEEFKKFKKTFTPGFIKMLDFYSNAGKDVHSLLDDILCDCLTENLTRDCRKVYWYLDGDTSYCVDESGHELDENEIEQQLC